MKSKTILLAELRRSWIQRKRYLVSTITSLISFGIVSFAAWIGLRAAFFKEGSIYDASAALLWPIVLGSFGSAAGALQEDIELGTIEQLYLSASSVLHLLHIRSLVSFLDSLAFNIPFLVISGFFIGWNSLGRWFLSQIIPVWIGLYGLGLIIAGLTLRFRQLGTLTNLLSLAIMAMAVMEFPQEGVWRWLAYGFPMVGISASPTWPDGWYLRYFSAGIYLLIGILLFRSLEAKAKKLGLIGKY